MWKNKPPYDLKTNWRGIPFTQRRQQIAMRFMSYAEERDVLLQPQYGCHAKRTTGRASLTGYAQDERNCPALPGDTVDSNVACLTLLQVPRKVIDITTHTQCRSTYQIKMDGKRSRPYTVKRRLREGKNEFVCLV